MEHAPCWPQYLHQPADIKHLQIGFVALLVTASVVFGLTVFAGGGSGDDSGFREASLASGKPDMPMQGSADWSSGRGNAASLARSAQLSELQACAHSWPLTQPPPSPQI